MEEQTIPNLLDKVLRLMRREKASDVYFRVGSPPILRIEGELTPVQTKMFSPEMMEQLAYTLMTQEEREGFKHRPECNLIYYKEDLGRFRTNIYKQRGTIAIVMREVRDDVLDFEKLRLPKILESLAMARRGLVLVTGPTGSGKSTTLAAMIRYRNENSGGHILTIEDPIEFLHTDIMSIISQREVGTDTLSFNDALESAVREAPDVLLIGEMRDVESVKAAVSFAETGHLVLSTLHSNNSVQTVERILQFFPTEIHDQIFKQLALNLRAVVAQRLISRKEGKGRVVAVEVMIVNARVSELLANGQLSQIKRELDVFHPEGMQSFDYALIELYKAGEISAEECIRNSDNPNDMKLKLKTLPVYIRSSGREDERYRE